MRASIIGGVCVQHDAISETILADARILAEKLGAECRIFTYACDYTEVPHKIVRGLPDLLFDRFFSTSDLVLFHFGIFYELFNSILLNFDGAKKAVRFHNITPREFASASASQVVDKSLKQLGNLDAADAIWAASPFSRDNLIEFGIPSQKVTVEPLFVKHSSVSAKAARRPDEPVEILYVGRFVKSKGLMDIVQAVDLLRARNITGFVVRLVGNLGFSDQEYISTLRGKIDRMRLDSLIRFEGQVSDKELKQKYAKAEILILPSYHEGFSMPVIEALQNKCIPIVYGSGNLPNLVSDFGVIVKTADVVALADGLSHLVHQHTPVRVDPISISGRWWTRRQYDAEVDAYLEQFSFDAYSERLVKSVSQIMADG